MKLNSIKTARAKILAQFDRISTDKGILSFDGEVLEVGMSVALVDEEGNETSAPDGEYRTEDGIVYVIADGKVEEIREPEINPEETPEPDPEPEAPVEAEDEPEAEAEPEADPRDEQIANLEAEVARLEEELGAARAENEQLRERIAELENKPAAEPAEEEFKKINKPEKTGDQKIDNLIRRFSKD